MGEAKRRASHRCALPSRMTVRCSDRLAVDIVFDRDGMRIRKDLDDAACRVAEVWRMLALAKSTRAYWSEALLDAHEQLFNAQKAFAAAIAEGSWSPFTREELAAMPRWLAQVLTTPESNT
jgi:hypothetical protein